MATRTKSISFKDKYKEQYDYLIKQDNPSLFICELIKKHMIGEDEFENRVKDIIFKYLPQQQVYQVTNTQNNSETETEDDDYTDCW